MAQNSIPDVAPPTQTLLAAYLAAHYRFELAGAWWPLAIGQAEAAALTQAWPACARTLITAWNPQSIPLARAVNDAADAALHAQLIAHGLPLLRAAASDAAGRWEEPGWLVAGLATPDADALAYRYGQAGILHWLPGQPVRLRMYGPCPAGHDGHPWVDWVQTQAP